MFNILVVDDNDNIWNLIIERLAGEGYHAFSASDGEEALEVMDNEHINLMIADTMMPKMDGLEVCRKIRDKTSCPIIFVTAKSRTLDMIVGLEMGGDYYIKKPFTVEELVAKVKAHIRRDKRVNTEDGVLDISLLHII